MVFGQLLRLRGLERVVIHLNDGDMREHGRGRYIFAGYVCALGEGGGDSGYYFIFDIDHAPNTSIATVWQMRSSSCTVLYINGRLGMPRVQCHCSSSK